MTLALKYLFFCPLPPPHCSLFAVLFQLGSLSSYLKEHASLPWQRKIHFAADTARGMAHVHGTGRSHRDLKSNNLLVSARLRIKVADFGTAMLSTGRKIEAPGAEREKK